MTQFKGSLLNPYSISGIGRGSNKPYISLKRLRPYLYEVTFDRLPEDNGEEDFIPSGCSAYVRDGKLFRTLDFKYDNAASFRIRTRDFEGMSFITGLDDGYLRDSEIAQLPYRIVDGRNNYGIMVSVHVLFNDWEWTGCGDKSVSITRLPYLVLSKVKSMATIASDLAGSLDNLKAIDGIDYILQMLITDGSTTYALIPPEADGLPYILANATINPKMANFRWVDHAEVSRQDADLQDRPTGIERFNAMPCSLEDLRFTKCYETADRLSEFIGIDDTTKDSADAELEAIYNIARGEYLVRQRDGKTWQTMHAVIYGAKMESLVVQEKWEDECIDTYPVTEQIGNLADLATDHKSNLVDAINELAEIAETSHFVISFAKSSAEMKAIYDACLENIILAKNIVFYNTVDSLYYRVNGYNMVNGALKLHTIMQGDSGLMDTVVTLASNGSLSVE